MNQSEQINELAAALSKMQGEVGAIPKNKTVKIPTKTGGSFTFSYADLAGIIESTRKPLSDNGLSFTQTFSEINNNHYMVSMLAHSSGQWIKSILPINVNAVDIKQLGAQITYSRRYALTALLGICADDDAEDGLEGNAINSHDKKAVPLPPAKISSAQLTELIEIFKGCDPAYVHQIMDTLKKSEMAIKNLNDLPITLFDRIKTAALNKRIEYQNSKMELEVANV